MKAPSFGAASPSPILNPRMFLNSVAKAPVFKPLVFKPPEFKTPVLKTSEFKAPVLKLPVLKPPEFKMPVLKQPPINPEVFVLEEFELVPRPDNTPLIPAEKGFVPPADADEGTPTTLGETTPCESECFS